MLIKKYVTFVSKFIGDTNKLYALYMGFPNKNNANYLGYFNVSRPTESSSKSTNFVISARCV